MKANELIKQVNESVKNNWENSDLCAYAEGLLEKIAVHFEHCEECRNEFDIQDYEETTLKEMEEVFCTSEFSDWCCEKKCKLNHEHTYEVTVYETCTDTSSFMINAPDMATARKMAMDEACERGIDVDDIIGIGCLLAQPEPAGKPKYYVCGLKGVISTHRKIETAKRAYAKRLKQLRKQNTTPTIAIRKKVGEKYYHLNGDEWVETNGLVLGY